MALLSKDKVTLEECAIADSERQNTEGIISKHKNNIRLLILILLAVLVVIGIIVILMLHNIYSTCEHTSNRTTTEPSNYYAAYLEDTVTEPSDNQDNYYLMGRLKNRNEWFGRPPISYINISHPVPMVIIKHTGGGFCKTFITCAGKVQTIQSQCVADGLPDIRYNFLIGGDGTIYVGRGWDAQPAHRNDTIDIAFIGTYDFDKLTPSMIEAAKLLLGDGVSKHKLSLDYKLVAFNQTIATESPGANVYKEIVTWPHYDGGIYFVKNWVP